MSIPFTAVQENDATGNIRLALAQELAEALNERALAVGNPHPEIWNAPHIYTSGQICQPATWWRSMQQAVLTLAGHYLDPTALVAGRSTLPVLTEARLYELAGLPGGFRRSTTDWPSAWQSQTDAVYSRGLAAAGDIKGPWLLADLQQAISALQVSYIGLFSEGDFTFRAEHNGNGYSGPHATPAQAQQAAKAARMYVRDVPLWPNLGVRCETLWSEGTGGFYAYVWVQLVEVRRRYHVQITHEAELYSWASAQQVFDANNLPVTYGCYALAESLQVPGSAAYVDLIFPKVSNPLAIHPVWSGSQGWRGWGITPYRASGGGGTLAIVDRWPFTRSNL